MESQNVCIFWERSHQPSGSTSEQTHIFSYLQFGIVIFLIFLGLGSWINKLDIYARRIL